MRILAINGSHRPGKGTAALLQAALDAAQGAGAETEFVELARLDVYKRQVVLELRQMVILLIHAHWHYPFPCGFISFAS